MGGQGEPALGALEPGWDRAQDPDEGNALPALVFAEVCLYSNDKASKEQLWNPGDLREAETIHWLFLYYFCARHCAEDFTQPYQTRELGHHFTERRRWGVICPRFHGEQVIGSMFNSDV